MKKHICESVQDELVRAQDDGDLSAAARAHLDTCAVCRGFQDMLTLTFQRDDIMDEPSAQLDQAVLAYAREHRPAGRRSVLVFPMVVKYAAAASLLLLFITAAWRLAHPSDAPGTGGEVMAAGPSAADAVWQGQELAGALGEAVAYVETADTGFADDISVDDEGMEQVADMIESDLAQLQADVYLASLTFE